MSDDDRDFHIDINIKGVWNVTKAVLPEMIARKDGRIVMMSSVTGDMVADPGETAYALTKAAIVGLTKSLAVEYAQSGIRVNAICRDTCAHQWRKALPASRTRKIQSRC
ncbi:short chain dehydrogenase [Escherichia coli]|nr:short chain dehydrogenase [Escherichia coli]